VSIVIDRNLVGLVAVFAAWLMPVSAFAETACRFVSKPVILASQGDDDQSGSMVLRRWDEPDRAVLSTITDPAGGYARYVAALDRFDIDTDPVALLRRSPNVNNALVAARAGEWIVPATCLEKLLLGAQHDRMDMIESPTEFVAIVMRHAREQRIRIYSYTINTNGIGRMTPITDAVRDDMANGWVVDHVVHNHPFQIAGPTLNGVLAPSIPDAGFHASFAKSHGVGEARITNGLNTVRIPASNFDDFER
jgi:hypothetical protein